MGLKVIQQQCVGVFAIINTTTLISSKITSKMSYLKAVILMLHGFWRIRMNYELKELIKNADIVRFVKSKRMAWLGHVMRMEGKRIHKRVLEWKPTGRRSRGRPRKRWIEDIEEGIQIMGIGGWRNLCNERAEWKKITEEAKTHSWLILFDRASSIR